MRFSEQYTDIVLQHHERIDGSGFPNGLKGDEISQNAKIVIVADVVDLITTYRAHNKPKNMNTAIRKLKIATDKYPQDLVDLLEKSWNNKNIENNYQPELSAFSKSCQLS